MEGGRKIIDAWTYNIYVLIYYLITIKVGDDHHYIS